MFVLKIIWNRKQKPSSPEQLTHSSSTVFHCWDFCVICSASTLCFDWEEIRVKIGRFLCDVSRHYFDNEQRPKIVCWNHLWRFLNLRPILVELFKDFCQSKPVFLLCCCGRRRLLLLLKCIAFCVRFFKSYLRTRFFIRVVIRFEKVS